MDCLLEKEENSVFELFQKDEWDSVTWTISFETNHYLGNSRYTKAAIDYGVPQAQSVAPLSGLHCSPGRQVLAPYYVWDTGVSVQCLVPAGEPLCGLEVELGLKPRSA